MAPGAAHTPARAVRFAHTGDGVRLAYTIDGAWLMRHETDTGSIETGKAADIVVLEKDLFKVAPREIGRVRVDLTMLDGEVLYRRPEASASAP